MKCWPLHSQSRAQTKRERERERERGGREFKEGWALPDESDDTTAGV